LTATLVTNPAHGTLSLGSNGSFSYMPNAGYFGLDSFTYEATNGYAISSPTIVSLSIGNALTWNGVSNGNWTDSQWSGASLPYPDKTVNAVVDTVGAVQVTSNQAANALEVQSGGQVAVAAGASLSITTETSVTGGGTLSVDPNGAFSTGGTLTLDSGGSLIGGPITAAAYQLNDGIASANLAGSGGLTKDTGGTVTLFGTNSYAGGTVVNAGTLIVTNSGAMPDGTILTVGVGGTFIFDPSQSASSVSAAGVVAGAPGIVATSDTAMPVVTASTPVKAAVTTPAISTVTPARRVHFSLPQSFAALARMPVDVSRAAVDSVLASHRSAFGPAIASPPITPTTGAWAWLAATGSSGNSSDQNKTTIEALDKVLARFGV